MNLTRTLLASILPAALLGAPAFAAESAPAPLTADETAQLRELLKKQDRANESLKDNIQNPIKGGEADARAKDALAHKVSVGDMVGGIDKNGKIVLQSSDKTFYLNIKGRIEARYLMNLQEDRAKTTSDKKLDLEDGFQLRRAQLWFTGHVGDPRVQYELMVAADRDTGGVMLADANMRIEASEELAVKFGKFKPPFAREELISSGNQLMVDRSSVLEMYTLDRANAIQMEYTPFEEIFGRVAWHSGGNSESQSTFDNELIQYAVATRWEYLAFGADKDMVDNVGLENNAKSGLLFGVAADYEKIRPGRTLGPGITAGKTTGLSPDANIDAVASYTADATYKVANWAFNVAGFGAYAQGVDGKPDYSSYGVTASVDYRINKAVDLFAHWQTADSDSYKAVGGSDMSTMSAITVGANWRYNSRLRFTGDVACFYDNAVAHTPYPLNGDPMSSGLGLVKDGANGGKPQYALRLQAQLQF